MPNSLECYIGTNLFENRVKLNIEISMANLVPRLTRGSGSNEEWSFIPRTAFSESEKVPLRNTIFERSATFILRNYPQPIQSIVTSASDGSDSARREEIFWLKGHKDVVVTVEEYGVKDRSHRWSNGMRRVYPRRRSVASTDERALQMLHL